MSMYAQQIEDAAAVRADFDDFLRAGDEENARAAIDIMGESYSELEALKMHQELNRAKNFLCLNWNGTCKEGHTQACREWNQEDAGKDEGEIAERALRADEEYV